MRVGIDCSQDVTRSVKSGGDDGSYVVHGDKEGQ